MSAERRGEGDGGLVSSSGKILSSTSSSDRRSSS